MKILFFQSLFSLNCMALSWLCDYSEIDGPTTTHVLYKEETSNIVKWLEKYEYCRAKGDPSVYADAGQPKCEYSRNLCVFINDECIFNQERENDLLEECQSLLYDNILSDELDWGRIPTESEQIESEQIESEQIESEQIESEDTGTEDTGTEYTGTEYTGTEYTGTEDTESVDTGSEDIGSEDTGSEDTGTVETGTVETECTETETSSTTETESAETESAEIESVFYSSAKLGVKSTLLLFSFPFFIV